GRGIEKTAESQVAQPAKPLVAQFSPTLGIRRSHDASRRTGARPLFAGANRKSSVRRKGIEIDGLALCRSGPSVAALPQRLYSAFAQLNSPYKALPLPVMAAYTAPSSYNAYLRAASSGNRRKTLGSKSLRTTSRHSATGRRSKAGKS